MIKLKTSTPFKKEEAAVALLALRSFFERKGIELDLSVCYLVDVFAWRIYTAANQPDVKNLANGAALEMVNTWDLV